MTKSVSVTLGAKDTRCRYWAKIFRADQALPVPSDVEGANDLAASYLRRGEEELFPGDVLIEGEANHHRRHDRGWTYHVTVVRTDGSEYGPEIPCAAVKAHLKKAGLPPQLLMGSGDIAACVRIAHGVRLGLL